MGAVASEAARIADQLLAGGGGASAADAIRDAVAETAAQAGAAKVHVAAAAAPPAQLNLSPAVAKDVICATLAAVIGSTAEGGSVKVGADSATVNGVPGTAITIATSQAASSAYTLLYGAAARNGKADSSRLFAAYLAARECGGAIKLSRQGENLSVEIVLPSNGQTAQTPDARPDWLDRMFQNFEEWPG